MLRKVYLNITYKQLSEHNLTRNVVEDRLYNLIHTREILHNEELDMHFTLEDFVAQRDSVGVKYIITIDIIDIYRGESRVSQMMMNNAFKYMTELLPTKRPEKFGAKE